MWDILSFNSFVTQDILIFFYYIFALILPIFLWQLRFRIAKIFNILEGKNKVVIIMILFVLFICMELCLRMVFEAMIGYFDIHNYLNEISQQLQKK
ncbi:DUF4282 domain-containing protein [Sulfurimonas sp.]